MLDGVRRVRLMLDAADLLLVRSSVADHRIHLTAPGLRDERGHHARSSRCRIRMRQIDTDPDLSPLVETQMAVTIRAAQTFRPDDDLRGTGCVVDRTHRGHETAGNQDALRRCIRRQARPAKKGGGHKPTRLAKNVGSRCPEVCPGRAQMARAGAI
jgi:hypothetical protein